MTWGTCGRCGKKLSHDEYYAESDLVSDGWTWDMKHKEEYCKKEDVKE